MIIITMNIIIIYLILLTLYLLFRLSVQQSFFKADEIKISMYKFYTVRDKLIYLVVNKDISENDTIFKLYYKNVNLVLRYFEKVEKVTLSDIVKLKDNLSKEDLEQTKKTIQATHDHKSIELKKIITQYHEGLLDLIMKNNTFATILKLLAFIAIPLVTHYITETAKKILSTHKSSSISNAYSFYTEQKEALAI